MYISILVQKEKYRQILLYFCLTLAIGLPSLGAQAILDKPTLSRRLNEAKSFLTSFKNDSALVVLSELTEVIQRSKEDNSPLGLRIQFRYAEALEKDLQSEKALERLLSVQKRSKEQEVWDVYTNSSIILARLYERIGLKDDCLLNLRKAESVINRNNEQDSIYPLFAVRLSSYHRIYDDLDSSLYYAQEVLRTAPLYDQPELKAVGHMLMGMLLHGQDNEERLGHFKAAANIFKKVEDYTGFGYMVNSVSGWYYSNGKLSKALLYNDSTITAAITSIANGHEEHRTLSSAYRFRGRMYKDLNVLDSAWYYLDKGYKLELTFIHEKNNAKVIEIDAKYKDEQKVQQIEEQDRQIKYERNRLFFSDWNYLLDCFSSFPSRLLLHPTS